jgi:Zn finger protein HypA/HybF involved in hydrogenase expression
VHEVSLVGELIDAVRNRSGDRPVQLVRVRHATTIPESVLRQAFEMLTDGGPLEAAVLEVEAFDVDLHCPCGFDGALGHDDLVGGSMAICPSCAEIRGLPATAELELLEVRIDS